MAILGSVLFEGPAADAQESKTQTNWLCCACSMAQDLSEQLKPRSSPTAPPQAPRPARRPAGKAGKAGTIKATQAEMRRWDRQASYLRQVSLVWCMQFPYDLPQSLVVEA